MSFFSLMLVPLSWAGLVVMFSSFLVYALLQTLCGTWYRTQNLKKRYNAQWALVTGSSSGERRARCGRATRYLAVDSCGWPGLLQRASDRSVTFQEHSAAI
jgi:hypothetical protein